jgi:hypothetical protein
LTVPQRQDAFIQNAQKQLPQRFVAFSISSNKTSVSLTRRYAIRRGEPD